MGRRQGCDPAPERLLERGRPTGGAQSLGGDRLDCGQRVLHPMVQLVEHQFQPRLVGLARCDVERDACHADRRAVGVVSGATADLHPSRLLVSPDHPELDVEAVALGERLAQGRLEGSAIGGVDAVETRLHAVDQQAGPHAQVGEVVIRSVQASGAGVQLPAPQSAGQKRELQSLLRLVKGGSAFLVHRQGAGDPAGLIGVVQVGDFRVLRVLAETIDRPNQTVDPVGQSLGYRHSQGGRRRQP